MLLTKPACCSAPAASAPLSLLQGSRGRGGKCRGEKSRQVCAQGGVGKEVMLSGLCAGDLQLCESSLPAHACKERGSEGREQLSITGGGA